MLSLLDRKNIVLGLVMVVALLAMSGCALLNPEGEDGILAMNLDMAIAEGRILPYVPGSDNAQRFTIVQPQQMSITTTEHLDVGFHFPRQERLSFERTGGYVHVLVGVGEQVEAGDLLAILSYEDDSLTVNRALAEIRLEQFDRTTAQTAANLQQAIATAQEALTSPGDTGWETTALNLELAEADYRVFRANTAAQREGLADAVDQIAGLLAGEELRAPFSGVVTRTITNGTFINTRSQIVTLHDMEEFFFVVSDSTGAAGIGLMEVLEISSVNLREMDGTPSITGLGRVLTDPLTTGARRQFRYMLEPLDPQGFLALGEAFPSLSQLFTARYEVILEVETAPQALAVPSRAIQSAGPRSFVHVYNNGNHSRRYVVTGAVSGGYTQIISGIDENMKVVMFP